jgi:ankyrin repeat protein
MSKAYLEQLLIDMARAGDNIRIQELISEKEVNPSACNNQAFWSAAYAGHLETLKLLLKDSRVCPSARKNAAIISAAENGHGRVVAFLLADERVNPAESGNLAFHAAARNGHFEVVKLFLADDRIDFSDANNNAVRRAAANGHLDIVKLILAFAANICDKKFDEVFGAASMGFIGTVSPEVREYLGENGVNKAKVKLATVNHAQIMRNKGLDACAANIKSSTERKKAYNNISEISVAIAAKNNNGNVARRGKSIDDKAWEFLSHMNEKKLTLYKTTIIN